MLDYREFFSEEKAQGMVEYSLLLSILVMGLVGAFRNSIASSLIARMVDIYNNLP
ncbi:MAG: hypothetical protein Q4A19_06820 [Johnsonella sp.]|nr:hypothetical protein [Johnsonella sp.]